MYEKMHSAGHNLYEIAHNQWIFQINGKIYSGTFRSVVSIAVTKFGFSLENIEEAVKEMINKGHNAVHFGMYKSWIYTFQKDFSAKIA